MSLKRLDPDDFVVSSDAVTTPMWTNSVPTLSSFYTSSIQEAGTSGQFYLSIYQTSSVNTSAKVQFDIAYADSKGSGSIYYNPLVVGKTPTRSIYGQFRNLVLEDERASFIVGQGTVGSTTDPCLAITSSTAVLMDHFWVVNIERANYKESIFPGSLNLHISGSGGTLKLTDNSGDSSINTYLGSTRALQIISGSNGTGTSDGTGGYTPNSGSYGLLLPDLGVMLLNPLAINYSIAVSPSRSNNSEGFNNRTIYDAISRGGTFTLNSQETISSDYLFIRAKNSEFNYTENPSFISGSTGEIIYDTFINNPITYLTTVGLYNDSNDLLAVAKMSRPLPKNFTKEALVRVKLDF